MKAILRKPLKRLRDFLMPYATKRREEEASASDVRVAGLAFVASAAASASDDPHGSASRGATAEEVIDGLDVALDPHGESYVA